MTTKSKADTNWGGDNPIFSNFKIVTFNSLTVLWYKSSESLSVYDNALLIGRYIAIKGITRPKMHPVRIAKGCKF